MNGKRWIGLALTSFAALYAAHAHAHFVLVEPASWLTEDELGGPQKGSPCGPGNSNFLTGDDVQPTPFSKEKTTFRAGETITVRMDETIYHPGYFRISLAKTSAAKATTEHFPDPPLTDPVDCHYDREAVPTGPHDNVLLDGLFTAEGEDGENRSLTQKVKLPDEPCDDCTLQIMQVMEGHPASSCFYYHCADIEIVAAAGSASDASDDDQRAGPAAESDGCSLAFGSVSRSSTSAAWSLLSIAAACWLRRRARRTAGS
jgi:hypothetical protein